MRYINLRFTYLLTYLNNPVFRFPALRFGPSYPFLRELLTESRRDGARTETSAIPHAADKAGIVVMAM